MTISVKRRLRKIKEFKVNKNDSGQRLDKFVTKVCPGLPASLLYKYIRLKRIKVNGKKSELAYRLSEGDILLDLYCGIGTIGLTCARKVKELIGIEVVEAAIEDAKENARINGIENAKFFAADAAQTLKIIASLPHKPNAVIVDPPRKGLFFFILLTAHSHILLLKCQPF